MRPPSYVLNGTSNVPRHRPPAVRNYSILLETIRWLSPLDPNSLLRLNEASWQLQNVAFNVSVHTDMDTVLYGVHSFQLLLNLLFSRA